MSHLFLVFKKTIDSINKLILDTFQIFSIFSAIIKRVIAITINTIGGCIPFKNQHLAMPITVDGKDDMAAFGLQTIFFDSYHQNNHVFWHIGVISIIIIYDIDIFQRRILVIILIQTIVRIHTHGIQIKLFRQLIKSVRIINRRVCHTVG